MSSYDVAICGAGPAGRALAHRLRVAGSSVLLVDPNPEAAWTQTLAGWRRLLPGWLPREVIGRDGIRPAMRVHSTQVIDDTYAVLDVPALQQALTLDGVDLERRTVDDAGLLALRERARVVVDARGAKPIGTSGAVPHQTAYGLFLDPELAGALVPVDADGVLMDWTTPSGGTGWGRRPPSFCYVIPMPDGRVLVEETCLAGKPALGAGELRSRLLERLARHGIAGSDVEGAESELVAIPLVRRGRPLPGVLRFGAAGAQHNPISGYSVFQALHSVDSFARSIVSGETPRFGRGPGPLRAMALRAVLRARPEVVVELFDAFARLDVADQRAVLDADTPQSRMALAMARQAMRMPRDALWGLVRATLL